MHSTSYVIPRILRSGWRSLLLALLFAGGIAGSTWAYFQFLYPKPKPLELPIAPATKTTVEITVNESGTVEWEGQQSLKSPGEVTVDRVLVAVGDRIQKGQQLVVLRSKQEQDSLAAKQLEIRKQELTLERDRQKVQEAQAKLQVAQREKLDPDKPQLEVAKQLINLERSRQKIAEAQAKITVEEKKLGNTEDLAAKGLVSGDELDQQRESVRQAQAGLAEAKLEAKMQQIGLEEAQQRELEKLQSDQQKRSEQQEKLLTAQAEVQNAKSAVQTAQQELERLRIELQNQVVKAQNEARNNLITAPRNGQILDLRVKDGDGVKIGDVLLTVGNPEQELIKLQLGTLDAAQVKVGQRARVKVIGPASQPYEGRVVVLNPQAIAPEGSEGRRSEGGAQARVPSVVQLDQPSGKLIPGSQVSVEIIVQQRRDVVALMLETVQRGDAEPFVWVQDPQNRAQKRPVQLGLEGVTQVEVVKGLRVGDRVIMVSPEVPITSGMLVKARNGMPTGPSP